MMKSEVAEGQKAQLSLGKADRTPVSESQ